MFIDTVTILRHPKIRQTKTWKLDGTIEPSANGKYFHVTVKPVADIHELSAVLTDIECYPHSAIIRGECIGDDTDSVMRRKESFRDVPHHWMMIDIDGHVTERDYIVDPVGATRECIETLLPRAFHGVSFHWQLSASAGHPSKGNGVRVHIWMWLSDPYASAQLQKWAKAVDLKCDRSLFDSVQLHYTAAPCFEEGVVDPIKLRSGFAEGEFGDVAHITIPDSCLSIDANESSDDWAITARSQDPETERNVSRVRSALDIISPDCSYPEWRDIVFSVLSTGWSCAIDLTREWSERSPERYDPDAFDVLVSSHREKPNGIRLGTLFSLAREVGWIDPSRKSESVFGETYGDISNGARFAGKYRGRLLYCHAVGIWYEWTDFRWKPCDRGEAVAAAKLVAEEGYREASDKLRRDGTETAKRNFTQALSVHRSVKRLEAMLQAASSEPEMSIAHPGEFDSDGFKLAVRNGVIDLRSGQLLIARPEMRISRQAGTAYDWQATCPKWLAFLDRVMDGDAEMVSFLQRSCGYALTGDVSEEKLFFCYGTGANGKSVFANVIAAALGEYAVTVRATLLARDAKSYGSEAEREKVRLPGARLVLINETGQADVWDDQRVKELVSRERISARYLHREGFDFFPTHKLFVRGNHQPGAMDTSDGFWRRIVLIGFTQQIPESERIQDLDRQIIEEELPGVLAWMVAGCLEWQKRGLAVPRSIGAGVEEYRRETDLLGNWIAACCRIDRTAEESVTDLFVSYSGWLKDANVKAPSRNAFGRQLKQREFPKRDSNGRTLYQGLSLLRGFERGVQAGEDEL